MLNRQKPCPWYYDSPEELLQAGGRSRTKVGFILAAKKQLFNTGAVNVWDHGWEQSLDNPL